MAPHVRPVDLEMRVKIVAEGGGTRLIYTLHSPTGAVAFSHREVAGPLLHGRPEDFQAHLLQKIEQLGLRLDVDGALLLQPEIERKLKSLGRYLWRELFPPEIRHAYRDIRAHVHSWMIVSDEPWIPWELIKLYEDRGAGEIVDDDFLAYTFELTRWLAGNRTPAQEIVVRHLAAIHTGSDLAHAQEELDLLTALARSGPGVVQTAFAYDSAIDLLGFLEAQDVDLLHFTGHGVHAPERPDESAVPFPDGSALRPVDLEGPLATRIGRTRPLVFQNACWGGQQGWAWAQLGGWAARWVGVCGCGAFVAPLWLARDRAALTFAQAFYEALVGGASLGQAALDARRRLRALRPGDPSALAYTVYGHPNAHLTIGDAEATAEPLPPAARKPEWFHVRRSRSTSWFRSRKAWAVASLLLCLLFAGWWRFSSFWKPAKGADSVLPPQATTAPVSAPTQTPPPPHEVPSVITAGGNRFEIAGGKGATRSSLRSALSKAAEPLAPAAISGWTVHLDLGAPQVTSFNQDGLAWKSCRLRAHGYAKRQGTSVDLETVSADSAQTDTATACDAAAEDLAKAVIDQFAQKARKGTS